MNNAQKETPQVATSGAAKLSNHFNIDNNSMVQAAQDYAQRGWHVFPVNREKRPLTENGFKDASTDPKAIAAWWARWPGANIGIATGASGLLVLDVDSYDGGEDTLASYPGLPDTVESITGGGGRHLLFNRPDGSKYKSFRFAHALDCKADGGYIVAPPSLHESGRRYEWEASSEPDDVPLADPPIWLVAIVGVDESEAANATPPKPPAGYADDTKDAFNAAHEPGAILERHGYRAAGDRWMHPDSTTGNFGVVQLPDSDPLWVFSHHGSDTLLGDGKPHDAFDCFRILEHGGDWRAAYREAEKLLGIEQPTGQADDSDLSHDQLALELSRAWFGENALYVSPWARWLLWDGARWAADEKRQHMTLTRGFLRDKAARYVDWAKRTAEKEEDPAKADKMIAKAKGEARTLRSDPTTAAVERMIRSNEEVAASPGQFDADLMLLGTPGGTVELRTGELRTAQRADNITKLAAVTPAEPGTDAPIWRSFLERIFRTEPEIVPFLQRAAGYALTGKTTEHKLLFAFGTGRNGKGVFFNTLGKLMGDYSSDAASSTFLESNMESHSTDLAVLEGSRLVTASELPPGKAWNGELIKKMTGDDPITARRMRQDSTTFYPQFTLMISGNHMPSFRGIDEATRARVLLIPFRETIPADERDPDLKEKLEAEWPAILRWAIDGAVEWQRIGLCPPAAVEAASEQYLDDEDELGQFVSECLAGEPDGFVPLKEIYETFKEWSMERGTRAPWQYKAFTQALRERGFHLKKRTAGQGILGYKLTRYKSSDYNFAKWGK